MTSPRHPAAYLPPARSGASGQAGQQAIVQAARQQGWPVPVVYADDPDRPGGQDPALDRLQAAITAGRHDALLMPMPGTLGDPAPLMRLLSRCTQYGVIVSLVPRPMAAGPDLAAALAASAAPAPHPEPWSVLTRARLEALSEIYPEWRIWLDQHGWQARRRGEGFLQGYRPGAPVFYVQAETAVDLAAQLCWQQAAEIHAPEGCRVGLPPAPWAAHT
jgi:hypothetical protein